MKHNELCFCKKCDKKLLKEHERYFKAWLRNSEGRRKAVDEPKPINIVGYRNSTEGS